MAISRLPTLLTGDMYARDLVQSITHATRRICIMTTTLRDDDTRSHAIIKALCAAADRGVAVSICADTFTYLEPKEFFLRSPRRQPARAYRALALERQFKRHGITFHWLGRKTNLIVSGRTHSKWSVIDDTVYSFGGVNLDNESFENTDYIMRLDSKKLADAVSDEHDAIFTTDKRGGARRSRIINLDTQNAILFDGGLPGDSVIYRRACTLARAAQRIVLVSQYCPTGTLNRIMKRKHADAYFNHWRHASSVNKILISAGMFTAKQQTLYTRDNYLHAKFIIFTMPDGHKVALSGSHNFMFGSGLTGTREVALETTDKHIIKQLETFRKEYVE